ncbi:hypothetical protein L9F63_005912 [Diploptera punctata]|uniref:Innexin n=1 Tax=Diploptera punctata TaxID=6984 RepID=A0AAD7ZBN0_DIPPU|nr:hypothetical protein L9F63_005912 [Diploptera punctata]
MRHLVHYLENAHLSIFETDVKIGEHVIPSKSERAHRLQIVRGIFLQRLHILTSWVRDMVLCEILNALLLICQVFVLKRFVGYKSELTFPKVTKCNFHKYGPSGTIQLYDALCVLPLNLFHEKIFHFLWYWYIVLCVMTTLGLVWRLMTFVLHSNSVQFNKVAYSLIHPHLAHVWELVNLTGENHFSDWLFLYYLGKNLDPVVFQELFLSTAAQIDV